MMLIGVLSAFVMNSKKIKCAFLLEMVLLLPWILPEAITGYTWKLLMNYESGIYYKLLLFLHIIPKKYDVFAHAFSAMLACVFANVWRSFPLIGLTTLAKLRTLPGDWVEAASLDGANRFRIFWHIELPYIRPVLFSTGTLCFIWTFNAYGIISVMTNGGPAKATQVVSILMQKQAFQYFDYSMASTYAVLILIILLVVVGFCQSCSTGKTGTKGGRKMHQKRSKKAGILFRYVLFVLVFVFAIFPIYWIISCSLRDTAEIQRATISVIPKTFTLSHYFDAFTKIGLLNSLKNSLIITFGTILVTVPLGLLGAYAFSKIRFPGKNTMQSMVMVTQFIPVVAYIVPLYLIMSKLHLLNTIYSLWITYLATAYPMAAILLVGYIQDVPDSLEEAALIDGCSRLQAMRKIVFPLAMPGIVTSAIFVFISIWQEYFIATSFVNQDKARTVSMAMQKFVTAHSTDWGGIMAASVIGAVPVVILFLSSRKMLLDNLAGGVKG